MCIRPPRTWRQSHSRRCSGRCGRVADDALVSFAGRLQVLADEIAEQQRELLVCFKGRREASIGPIIRISHLLALAHYEYHKGSNPDRLTPLFELTISRNGTGGDVVCICYEAAGLPDPERALKRYMDMLRLSEHCTTDLGVRIPEAGDAIPKRKAGRRKKRGR